MGAIDIIPDIHGQHAKLLTALAALGWRRGATGWSHPEPHRRIVFLGDFIDRGPDNRAVIRTVRALIDAGRAQAIMGNHELNALHFHTRNPADGRPLRAHSPKNRHQHGSFLAEFPLGAPETREVLDWMRGLPLFLEEDGFRAVHACWSGSSIHRLRELTGTGVLSEEQLIRAADRKDELFHLVEVVAKGPEQALPEGHTVTDADGTPRDRIRVQWWNAGARSWREIAASVPDPGELPDAPLPAAVLARTYPAAEPPVFFGHYWLTGTPVLQGPNALCLDYSAGRDGPLASYEWRRDDLRLSPERIRTHAAPG